MQRDLRLYLWEIREAGDRIATFIRDQSFDDYLSNVLLRSAVERQAGIIGEAIAQLTKLDPTLVARLPDASKIVGFRNRLIHGYMDINDRLVWSIANEHVPQLRAAVDALLQELGNSR